MYRTNARILPLPPQTNCRVRLWRHTVFSTRFRLYRIFNRWMVFRPTVFSTRGWFSGLPYFQQVDGFQAYRIFNRWIVFRPTVFSAGGWFSGIPYFQHVDGFSGLPYFQHVDGFQAYRIFNTWMVFRHTVFLTRGSAIHPSWHCWKPCWTLSRPIASWTTPKTLGTTCSTDSWTSRYNYIYYITRGKA